MGVAFPSLFLIEMVKGGTLGFPKQLSVLKMNFGLFFLNRINR